MLSVSSLIEFLLGLLRDDEAQAEFTRDPQAVLARHGLEGVTAQDVCDARPMLADVHGVNPRPHRVDHDDDRGSVQVHHHDAPQHHHYHRPQSDDPVREIHHVTKNYEVDKDVVVKHHTQNTYNEYNNEFNYYDHSVTTGDDSTVIQDSFNEDNDGVDNKGGIINDSNVAGDDQDDVGNSEETTVIDDSFNEDNSETTEVEDSFNDESDNSTTVADSGNDSSTDVTASVNDSYNVEAPITVADDVEALSPADSVA